MNASACARVTGEGSPADASTSAGDAEADTTIRLTDGGADAEVVEASEEAASEASPGGSCASAASYLDGGCGDPLTDPHNCGACGHDCLGGACDAGACVPLPVGVLATGQFSPIAMAVDGTSVYWLDWGASISSEGGGGLPTVEVFAAQVVKCAVGGCGNRPTVLATLSLPTPFPSAIAGGIPTSPSALAVDATNVYWTEQTAVRACAIGGCGCSPTTIATGVNQPPGVAAAAGSAFWTVWAHGAPYTGTVETCPITGCVGGPTILAHAQGGPLGLVSDGTDVSWVDTYANNGSLMMCPVGGCNGAPTQLWASTGVTGGNPIGVVGDATRLYWTNGGPGSVMECQKADCPGTLITLASGRNRPSGIAVDGADVYWREDNVYKCAIGGCNGTPTLVATASIDQFSWDAALALDSTRVYWTQGGTTPNDGRIMWAVK